MQRGKQARTHLVFGREVEREVQRAAIGVAVFELRRSRCGGTEVRALHRAWRFEQAVQQAALLRLAGVVHLQAIRRLRDRHRHRLAPCVAAHQTRMHKMRVQRIEEVLQRIGRTRLPQRAPQKTAAARRQAFEKRG